VGKMGNIWPFQGAQKYFITGRNGIVRRTAHQGHNIVLGKKNNIENKGKKEGSFQASHIFPS
jgi:hypothetical protein